MFNLQKRGLGGDVIDVYKYLKDCHLQEGQTSSLLRPGTAQGRWVEIKREKIQGEHNAEFPNGRKELLLSIEQSILA